MISMLEKAEADEIAERAYVFWKSKSEGIKEGIKATGVRQKSRTG